LSAGQFWQNVSAIFGVLGIDGLRWQATFEPGDGLIAAKLLKHWSAWRAIYFGVTLLDATLGLWICCTSPLLVTLGADTFLASIPRVVAAQ
jgi:hypothetical protein